MPFVRISLRNDTPLEIRQRISAGVHQALVQAIGIPEGELYQVINSYPSEDMIYNSSYAGIEYQNIVFIEIALIRGRSEEKKLSLYNTINKNLASSAGMRPEDVVILLTENDRVDWSMANGEAQLLKVSPRS